VKAAAVAKRAARQKNLMVSTVSRNLVVEKHSPWVQDVEGGGQNATCDAWTPV
jgi:hypothetical protein